MSWGDIESMWVVLAPLAVAVLAFYAGRARRDALARLVSARLMPEMVVDASPTRRTWKTILRVLAALFLGLAIMRPQWGEQSVDVARRGIDIVFVVDTSKSMLAEDVRPNRIARVKQDVRYFVENVVQDDRIGLVAFAGTAQTLCPLSLDRAAFNLFLDEMDVGVVPRGGTDLGAAIEDALEAFGDDVRNHKAIILFSDGEAHDGIPDAALEKARKLGVRIYTIGIGSADGVRIPVLDEDGKRTFLKDSDGSIVQTRLDDRILKTIAQRSLDGAYTHLSAGRGNLEKIYLDNIKKIEERELKSRRRVRRVERFQWFLAAALGLLMIECLIADGVRTKSSTVMKIGRSAAA